MKQTQGVSYGVTHLSCNLITTEKHVTRTSFCVVLISGSNIPTTSKVFVRDCKGDIFLALAVVKCVKCSIPYASG